MNNTFFKRLFAYFLDMIIVSMVLGLLFAFIPNSENSKKLIEERNTLASDFIDGRVEAKEFASRAIEIGYDQAKEEVPFVILDIAGILLYFVVFQAYNNGQTLGKKIVKLKIVSNAEKELGLDDYLKRLLIVPPAFCTLLDLILLLFAPKNIYLGSNIILNILQILLLLITGFMVIYRKDERGLQDLIAGTKVIDVKGDVKSERV